MGGGAFHPRRKRQSRGRGAREACTQGQGHRPGWPVAGLEKGAGRGPMLLGSALATAAGASNELDNKQPAWIFYLPPFCAEERNQKD